MDARLRRVNKEIAGKGSLLAFIDNHPRSFVLWNKDCKNDRTSSIRIELIDNSPFHLKGSFPGPEETPYEGGNFDVVRMVPLMALDR
jgi:ubiquitin-conjugating enzyme (huntingtin interacting protein 2)